MLGVPVPPELLTASYPGARSPPALVPFQIYHCKMPLEKKDSTVSLWYLENRGWQ